MFGKKFLHLFRLFAMIALFEIAAQISLAAIYTPTGMPELRNAIQQANANAGLDTINLVSSGLYSFSASAIADSAKGIVNPLDGDLDITDDLVINGNNSIIDASNRDRVFYIQGSTSHLVAVTINQLTMRNGLCDPTVSPNHGGAIYGHLANLSINNSAISGCSTSENGGAIAIFGYFNPSVVPTTTRSTLAMNGVSILNNSAANGGSIMSCLSHVTISDCDTIGNATQSPVPATLGGGAALITGSGTNVSISNHSNIANNSSVTNSGGLGFLSIGSANIAQSLISGNSAAISGGGVYCIEASPSLINCVLSGNSATDSGGGIFSQSNSAPSATNCTVSHNSALSGAGFRFFGSSIPSIKNTVFEGNSSGAIAEGDTLCDPIVQNCLFYGNVLYDYLDEGVAGLIGASAINNLAQADGNLSGDPKSAMNGPGAITGTWTAAPSYNSATKQTTLINASAAFAPNALAGRMVLCDVSLGRNQNHIVSNTGTSIVVSGDVRSFATAADTYKIVDYHPEAGSAALDVGTNLAVPATDFDGVSRPYDFPGIGFDGPGNGYDIGAYEFRITATPTPTPTRTPTPSPTPTRTMTPSPTATATATRTSTPTPTATVTNTPSPTSTPTKTNTPTPTKTSTQSPTPTAKPKTTSSKEWTIYK